MDPSNIDNTCEISHPEEQRFSMGKFSEDELRQAFTLIENPKDWKGPIATFIPIEQREIITYAIPFVTATNAIFQEISNDPTKLYVTAKGYRAGPAKVRGATA
jgi:hypothetical protein